ncbi:hypothetical protein RB597_007413 [Gaeumannomyces tritici]
MSFHPQTPQSPSQSSPSTSDPTASLNTSMTSITSALPTPAHSVTGSCIPSEMHHDTAIGEESPQKRKRTLEDGGDRDQKKAHLENRRLGIENLHLDVGEKYLLCRSQHRTPYPRVSEDLFEAYDLTGIAAEVARVLPNGEKNAMRKTYKGHIKKLGVVGHFDSVKKDVQDPDSFLALLWAPAEDWINTEVHGKDITAGLSSDVLQNLGRATTMARGPITKRDWDSSVLGDLSSDKAAGKTSSAKATAPNTPLNLPPMNRPKVGQQPPIGDANRPRRAGKKRSYGDSSFEGYGEAFADDQDVGYSTGEGDERGGQKRRKKVLLATYASTPCALESLADMHML